jgi:hypothetical protein
MEFFQVSVVLAHDGCGGDAPPLALKRLAALFRASDGAALDAYEHTVATYVDALAARGLRCVPTAVLRCPRDDGCVAAYLAQPRLARERLLPVYLHDAATSHGAALTVFGALLDAIAGVVDARVGLDGQLSNWVLDVDPAGIVPGDAGSVRLLYLDNSTPFMKDGAMREMLDLGAFLVTLPWLIRVIANRFLLNGIIAKYYSARLVVLDLLGNMLKERLEALLPAFLDAANARYGPTSPRPLIVPPITLPEVRSYYTSDARVFRALQWVRRAERWVKIRMCRRPYPHLIPPPIER